MLLLKKEQAVAQGQSAASCAPIVRALTTLPDDERAKLRKKFNIAYFVAMESMPLRKYSRLCELEARHGVEIGSTYTDDNAGKTFVHYIAESRKQELVDDVKRAKFFSLLIDGSTDKGNYDNEVVMVALCDTEGSDEKIHTRLQYFTVMRPAAVSGSGLFAMLENSLKPFGIEAINATQCKKLVGIATDGASANIAAGGLKGQIEGKLNWIFWMWCLAHRLELAIKDALSHTSFDLINEMLLRLYYLYENSPKKCRELEDVISDLRECMAFDDAGVKPAAVRSSGSRWVSHKLSAMKRVLSKYGAYTNHFASLSKDASIKPTDRSKLKGYYTKWVEGKYLLGCALFTDLLSPCSIFSKQMQSDDLDILEALTSLVRTLKETEKLCQTPLDQWPTYDATIKKCTTEDGEKVYQCQEVKHFSAAQAYYTHHYQTYCTRISECIKSHLQWSDLQLIRGIIWMLATQGWEKIIAEEESLEAINRLVDRFTIPLLGASADLEAISGEFKEMVHYAIQYISLATLDYRSVWWRLFHAPTSSEWSNVLLLVELHFSLPSSNGKVERVFSQLNNIKTNKRTRLGNETVNDLLGLTTEQIPLSKFSPDSSIDLWWSSKTRRPNQKQRTHYSKRGTNQTSDMEEDSDNDTSILDDWDKLMVNDSSDSESESD